MGRETQHLVADSAEGGGAGSQTPSGGFVHLHLHSEYSLLDGGNRIDRLVARVKELGMDAVAVTDHGNMHAAAVFWQTAKAAGIKPIMGVEAYVAPSDRRDRTYTGVQDGGYHLVLLAENQTGWENLLYLCSEAYLSGFYFKPRMDREILEAHSEGLIAINGHLGSELAYHLLQYERSGDDGCWASAVDVARWHAQTFRGTDAGPGFYVELQHHVPEQNSINKHLIRLAEELDLPLVCDNDSHFLRAEDHDAHDTLICISMGKHKSDESRLRYPTELYVKSPEEMRSLFEREYGEKGREACDNTVRIAKRCNVDLPLGENHAPVVKLRLPAEGELPSHDDPSFGGDLTAWHAAFSALFELEPFDAVRDGADQSAMQAECDRALRQLSEAGMVWRYGPEILKTRHEKIEVGEDASDGERKWARLNRELKILSDKLISAYFLIVWDFVNWGRQKDIPALARGSGVGTMVGYVLGLSNACPVRYGLLFERFTDPDRSEYPDIDIDLCQDGRGEVIDYVRRKYGHVAQIITFGTLKARAAVRDVSRVLEVPLAEADRIAKLIPESLGMTLDKAMEEEPELKKLYNNDDQVRRVIDTGRVFEGQARHASVHAAGVIVATRPLHEIVPLYKQSGAEDHEIVTQWDGPTCEKVGLLKMDFLGLRTLSVIERCKQLIRESLPEEAVWRAVGRDPDEATDATASPHPLDLERLHYDDQRVFDLFQRGDTAGVFQFESGGMRRLLVEMKPDRLEDLIAANALFRPGPMDLIPDYNRRKHGQDKVPSVHPIVDGFTAETYGVMVYQEQVMQIVHELGGIPLRAAYGLIKAISKKKEKIIAAERPKFIEGAQSQGLDKTAAEELFELILKFAGYGFNKSHSTGYAIVAYQTAYLKTYFPKHYMAAFLSFESQAQKVADWIPYLEDCKRTRAIDPQTGEMLSSGVEVRPPDVNLSQADFSVVYEPDEPRQAHAGHVRFGMRAIKGAGSKAIEAIIRERDEGSDDGDAAGGPYTSLHEFCERVPPGTVNKATIESLITCGAFDRVHGRENRAAMVETIEQAVAAGQRAAQDKASGQAQLFGMFGGDEAPSGDKPAAEVSLVKAEPWSEAETLKREKETLGFYVSSHPLDEWRCWSDTFARQTLADLKQVKQDNRVIVAAMVQSVRTIVVKNGRSAGQKMGILTIEDTSSTAEAVLFADAFARFSHLLEDDAPKFFLGRVDHSRGDPQIIIDRLVPIEGVPLERGRLQLHVPARASQPDPDTSLRSLLDILSAHAPEPPAPSEGGRQNGRTNGAKNAPANQAVVPFELKLETDGAWVTLAPQNGLSRVRLQPELIREIRGVLGEGAAQLHGGVAVEMEPRNERRNGHGRRNG